MDTPEYGITLYRDGKLVFSCTTDGLTWHDPELSIAEALYLTLRAYDKQGCPPSITVESLRRATEGKANG